MLIEAVIILLGIGDYYLVVRKNSEYNSTGRTELWTLNSDGYVAVGTLRSLSEIFYYKTCAL